MRAAENSEFVVDLYPLHVYDGFSQLNVELTNPTLVNRIKWLDEANPLLGSHLPGTYTSLIHLSSTKMRIGWCLKRPDRPPVAGYRRSDDNSLLSVYRLSI